MAVEAISQSTLGMALKCGEQLNRRFGLESGSPEIIPPGIAALRGTGVHKAAEVNHRHKLETHEDLPLSDLKDAARDGFKHRATADGVYILPEDQGSKVKILNEGLEDTHRCVKVYSEDIAPGIQPVGLEERFVIDGGFELPLSFQIDWWTEDHIIGDLKTTDQKKPKDAIKEEIQPVFYSYGYWKHFQIKPKSFDYHYMIARRSPKTGKPTSKDADFQAWVPEDKDYQAMFARIEAMLKMLRTGTFSPSNQNNWWCGPKWCGYWHTCKYVGNAPAKGRWV